MIQNWLRFRKLGGISVHKRQECKCKQLWWHWSKNCHSSARLRIIVMCSMLNPTQLQLASTTPTICPELLVLLCTHLWVQRRLYTRRALGFYAQKLLQIHWILYSAAQKMRYQKLLAVFPWGSVLLYCNVSMIFLCVYEQFGWSPIPLVCKDEATLMTVAIFKFYQFFFLSIIPTLP